MMGVNQYLLNKWIRFLMLLWFLYFVMDFTLWYFNNVLLGSWASLHLHSWAYIRYSGYFYCLETLTKAESKKGYLSLLSFLFNFLNIPKSMFYFLHLPLHLRPGHNDQSWGLLQQFSNWYLFLLVRCSPNSSLSSSQSDLWKPTIVISLVFPIK